MDFRQLEVFTTVVKEGNFSRAAKRLYLTQPTVSAHMEALENDCGVKLFERRNRKTVLTEAGKKFYPYAEDILGLKDRARENLEQYNEDFGGEINIKASQTPGIYLLPKLLAPFQKQFPRVKCNIYIYDTEEVFTRISQYEADLGFVGSLKDIDKVSAKQLLSDTLVLIASSPWKEELEAKYQKNGALYLGDILHLPFIFRSHGSATRKTFETALKERGKDIKDLNIVCEMDNLEGVKNLVRQGIGVSFISDLSIETHDNLSTFTVEDIVPNRNFYVIYHKNRVLSPTCECLMEHLLNNDNIDRYMGCNNER
ncbi:selenium metabolism-associated LysR family transcriptional regulator [Natranaerobius trueperi]|uniref:LysR family transcriptional regulator n=1 Tax=Natranaerobius trueperi TaxID=759412 RepID=A0A226C3H4_9FIRM|nr:selenium metabolism-associated LysR family transcriptional regulator [Natranaerobius trueperi]OWZ84960.1 LysR family transcriptional regulator [Natranaerobius trueperi]